MTGNTPPALRPVEEVGTTLSGYTEYAQAVDEAKTFNGRAYGVDDDLLGDWIKDGTFDPDRLARRFDQELGGKWAIAIRVKSPNALGTVYEVEIARAPGT